VRNVRLRLERCVELEKTEPRDTFSTKGKNHCNTAQAGVKKARHRTGVLNPTTGRKGVKVGGHSGKTGSRVGKGKPVVVARGKEIVKRKAQNLVRGRKKKGRRRGKWKIVKSTG